MSLKNTKNLLIIAAVVVALMAGTVLLGNYTNILSTGSQPKTCQATGSACCPAANAFFAENANVESSKTAEGGAVTKTCPLDGTKPCCAGEAKPDCCPKTCPPDCTKPCCAGEAAPGCCPKSDASATANTGCCPATGTTAQ
ncbi:MAG: hypothetical protein HQ580_09230 [Planctomycetes bacterium]|nr:hypothetical protein [Planctomycetota bacterium]